MPLKIKNTKIIKRRRSIRLKGYDYSRAGLYFITICTWNQIKLFGKIENDRMCVSIYGEVAEREWQKTGELRPYISQHEYIIMPNHIHGIIEIKNYLSIDCRGTACRAQIPPSEEKYGKPTENTIPTIIRSYKAAVTKKVRELMNDSKVNIWQKNYYEHIIRNEESYLKISEYIMSNPMKWNLDKYYR